MTSDLLGNMFSNLQLEIIQAKIAGESSRSIAERLLGSKTKKSSVNDIYNRYLKLTSEPVSDVNTVGGAKVLGYYNIATKDVVGSNVTHLMIPDTQCKPNIDMSYLDWVGKYIVDKKPEVIVHIGDHADMESLSSYDKGQRSAEGKRVQKDIDSAIEGMNRLLKPLYDLQQHELKSLGKIVYKPKMVFTLGNHEQRIARHVNANPELHGFLSYDNLKLKEMGWEVYDYLQPVSINGVTYVHFMANPMTGKPYGGTALNILKNVGESFCMGHKQCLDVSTRFLPSSGKQQWAIIAGACYPHDEDYKGYQGNHHWRGVVVQHNVKDGSFNPMFVSLDYLKERYAS